MFWQTAHASTIALPQAATNAMRVDQLHDFLWWLSVVPLAGTTFAVLYFAKKYHRSQKGRETAYILGSHTLEMAWTVIPLILMLGIFAWGYKDYLALRAEPQNAYEINVNARQWLWNFQYSNGRKTMNELYLPKGRPVRLIMTSEDVLHSFFVPNFRAKQDVVPGMYTYISFEATIVGSHPVYCTEYCGTGHSDMLARAIVLEQEDFDKWLETGKAPTVARMSINGKDDAEGGPIQTVSQTTSAAGGGGGGQKAPAQIGQELFASKGCTACHAVDGTRRVGPALNGIFGHEQELEDGSKAKVDENYIRQSLMEPQSQIAKGFPPSMPTFKGLLSDDEVNALIAYIKSLK